MNAKGQDYLMIWIVATFFLLFCGIPGISASLILGIGLLANYAKS